MSFFDLAAAGPPGVAPLPSDLARLLVPPVPGAPLVRTRRAAWRWIGTILSLALPPELGEREYLALLVDGARPVAHSRAGTPIYRPSGAALRRGQRALERLALGGHEAHNVACNAGRTVLLDLLGGVSSPTGITYFAVGTGAGTPTSTDTTLFGEVFRKQITGTVVNANQLVETCYFQATEGVYTYTEAGLFGNGASGTINSGTLFAHAAYNYQKTDAIALTNQYYITLS